MGFANPFQGKNIQLRLAVPEDAEVILSFRLDENLNKYLSKVENDVKKQRDWLRAYQDRERKGEEYYFIIESLAGDHLGTVRLYDFQGDSFCWGSWIVKPGAPHLAALESALLVYEIAFGQLEFFRTHFDVRKGNERAIAFHERFGVQRIREDQLNYYYSFSKDQYAAVRQKYSRYLPPGR